MARTILCHTLSPSRNDRTVICSLSHFPTLGSTIRCFSNPQFTSRLFFAAVNDSVGYLNAATAVITSSGIGLRKNSVTLQLASDAGVVK
jgi:hypothetical protein